MNKLLWASCFLILIISGCGGSSTERSPFIPAASVTTGNYHACAPLTDRTVRCWGKNSSGQLGNSSSLDSFEPVAVTGITSALQVSAGGKHTCAALSTGSVKCWGDNSSGQLGNGTTTPSNSPVTVTGIIDAVSVSAGEDHTCAVLSTGSVQCWGLNTFGQLGDGSTNFSSTPVTVTGVTTASSVSAGSSHTCAALSTGGVSCWGSNLVGQLGDPTIIGNSTTPVAVTGITTASGVAAGFNHTCSNLSDGTVRCWGDNLHGQLGIFWPVVGGNFITNSASPVQVSINSVVEVAAGLFHSCARTIDNRNFCWGENFDGQLGNGNFVGFVSPAGTVPSTSTTIPVLVSSITAASSVDTGFFFSCSRVSSGHVFCWGNNDFGQLGVLTGLSSPTPVQVISW